MVDTLATFDPSHVTDAAAGIEQHVAFDYDAVARALGEAQDGLDGDDRAKLGLALLRILQWLGRDPERGTLDRNILARRTLALLWATDPALVGGESLRKLSKRLGFSKSEFSRDTSATRREFNLVNVFNGQNRNFKA